MSENQEHPNESGAKDRPRPYRLGQREVAMEETRNKILKAAREIILGESALERFSLDAVARRAGVTRVTVYHRFGSKRGLLEALFDEIGAAGHLREKLPVVFSHHDPIKALQAYIEVFCDFWEADRVLNRRLRGFVALDSDFAAAIASRYERRHHSITALLSRLEVTNSPSEEMTQTVLALTGFEFYDVLARETQKSQEVAQSITKLVLVSIGVR